MVKREADDETLVLLHGKPELPIYSVNNKFLTTQEAFDVLLDSDLSQDAICTKVPFSVSQNGIFVVDLNKLESINDVLCDDMGVWTANGSLKRWCSISVHGFVKLLEKGISSQELDTNSFHIWKRYYYLKSSPDV